MSRHLRCEKCGASAIATCECDHNYVPARVFAARFVAAHPEMSDGAIAEAIGVSASTVRRNRPSTSSNDEVEKRIVMDGKVRSLPTPREQRIADNVATLKIKSRATPEERIAAANAGRAFFGLPISEAQRKKLVDALDALPLEHPVARIQQELGLSWNEIIPFAQKEEAEEAQTQEAAE
jgi:hypothetical protein